MSIKSITTVIFDLGGVLIDWNPRYLYRKLLADEAQVEWFLANVCTQAWNEEQDSGRPFSEAVALLVDQHPEHEALIRAYDERWNEMVRGPVPGTAAVLDELHAAGVRLLALTNWSAEKFSRAQQFEFLGRFEGIVVSGAEGVRKPEPAIYECLFARYDVTPSAAVFIDDSAPNVDMGRRLGLHALQFRGAEPLRAELAALGLL